MQKTADEIVNSYWTAYVFASVLSSAGARVDGSFDRRCPRAAVHSLSTRPTTVSRKYRHDHRLRQPTRIRLAERAPGSCRVARNPTAATPGTAAARAAAATATTHPGTGDGAGAGTSSGLWRSGFHAWPPAWPQRVRPGRPLGDRVARSDGRRGGQEGV